MAEKWLAKRQFGVVRNEIAVRVERARGKAPGRPEGRFRRGFSTWGYTVTMRSMTAGLDSSDNSASAHSPIADLMFSKASSSVEPCE